MTSLRTEGAEFGEPAIGGDGAPRRRPRVVWAVMPHAPWCSMRRRQTSSSARRTRLFSIRVRSRSTAKRVTSRWTGEGVLGPDAQQVGRSRRRARPTRSTITRARAASRTRRVVAPADDDPQPVVGERREQLVRRRGPHESPAVEDRDAVGDPLDVVEDVGRVEDRRLALEARHQLEDLAPSDRVERADRLVEQQDLGPRDHRLGDAEPLAHAARVRLRPPVGGIASRPTVPRTLSIQPRRGPPVRHRSRRRTRGSRDRSSSRRTAGPGRGSPTSRR